LIFAGVALFHNSRAINKLVALWTKKYTFCPLGESKYEITPCPPNYYLIGKLSNVIWVEENDDRLLLKAETMQAVEDIVNVLNCRLTN
jgi:hypothetical protein